MTHKTRLLLAAATALAATPAQAVTYAETFGDPFAGWEGRWFGTQTNASNWYVTDYGDPADNRGSAQHNGLVLSDGVESFVDGRIAVLFGESFGRSLTQFGMDLTSSISGLRLSFFDRAGVTLTSLDVAQSLAVSPVDGTPLTYQRVSVTSANGIGGFTVTDPAKGFVIVDNLFASDAAVPEPGSWAMMIVGLGLAGATLRRRRTAVRWA